MSTNIFGMDFLVICLVLLNCKSTTGDSKINVINQIIASASLHIQRDQVTVFFESSNKLSCTSTLIMPQMLGKFSKFLIEMNTIHSSSNSRDILQTRKSLSKCSEKLFSKIVFIDGDEPTKIEQDLINFVNFLITFTAKSVRPNCLIFLINGVMYMQLLKFFKYVWAHTFLD